MDLARFSHLTTKRLRLAPQAEADPVALAEALNDFEVTRWLARVPHPYGLEDAHEIIARRKIEPALVWQIYDDDGLAGGVGLDKHLGFWLARRAWGHGYATEAARAVLAAHFADPAAGDVGSSYFLGNDASARVLDKLGFVDAGPGKLNSLAQGREVNVRKMLLARENWDARNGV